MTDDRSICANFRAATMAPSQTGHPEVVPVGAISARVRLKA